MSEDEHAIRNLVTTWMAASKAGDLQKVLNMTMTPPGGTPMRRAQAERAVADRARR